MTTTPLRRLALAGLFWAIAAPALHGQAATLDEGEFALERNGLRIGSESFTIQRSGFGANQRVIARSTVQLDEGGRDSEIRSALLTQGPALRLELYESSVSGRESLELKLENRGERLRLESSRGTAIQVREFRTGRGQRPTLVVDQFLAHHHYFVARIWAGDPARATLLVPRALAQHDITVRSDGVETLVVGGQSIQAQKLVVEIDGAERRIWTDLQNRVLRVEVPAEGLVAQRRDAPPR